jgi:hypothetical protein
MTRSEAELQRLLEDAEDSEHPPLPATKTVVVIGAGASHGSECGKPPLVSNFWEATQRAGLFDAVEFAPLWAAIESEAGLPPQRLLDAERTGIATIEQVYSLISATDDDPKGANQQLFERLVHRVLTGATKVYKNNSCSYHNAILRTLHPDVIVSFNYDLIMDRSIETVFPGWEKEQLKRYDYIYNGEKFVHNSREPSGTDLAYPLYFKLHGSLNRYFMNTLFEQTRAVRRWLKQRHHYYVPLEYAFDVARIYQYKGLHDYAPSTLMTSRGLVDRERAALMLDMVPPIYSKRVDDWESVQDELKQARKIVFIGYSLPDSDLGAWRLFQRAYHSHGFKKDLTVELVSPGSDGRTLKKLQVIYSESRVAKIASTIREYAFMDAGRSVRTQ